MARADKLKKMTMPNQTMAEDDLDLDLEIGAEDELADDEALMEAEMGDEEMTEEPGPMDEVADEDLWEELKVRGVIAKDEPFPGSADSDMDEEMPEDDEDLDAVEEDDEI